MTSDVVELEEERAYRALIDADGNVTKAARLCKMDPERLRRAVKLTQRLKDAVSEAMERTLDEAVDVVIEGLRDKASFQNRFYSAKVIMTSEAARARGFGRAEGATAALEIGGKNGGVLTLRWLEPPDEIGPNIVEGTVIDGKAEAP